MDTDDYFWEKTNPPYIAPRPVSERLRLMKNDINAHENVVIAGSLVDWGDELIFLFTLAIRVITPTSIRIERIKRREYKRFGSRIEAGGDLHEAHIKFIDWAASYDEGDLNIRSKAKHDEWQKKLFCPILFVDGSKSLEKNFNIINEFIKKQEA